MQRDVANNNENVLPIIYTSYIINVKWAKMRKLFYHWSVWHVYIHADTCKDTDTQIYVYLRDGQPWGAHPREFPSSSLVSFSHSISGEKYSINGPTSTLGEPVKTFITSGHGLEEPSCSADLSNKSFKTHVWKFCYINEEHFAG